MIWLYEGKLDLGDLGEYDAVFECLVTYEDESHYVLIVSIIVGSLNTELIHLLKDKEAKQRLETMLEEAYEDELRESQ